MDKSFEIYSGGGMNSNSREKLRRRIDWLAAQARGDCLDIGSSQGIVEWLVAQKPGNEVTSITGIDNDPASLGFAMQKIAELPADQREKVELIFADFSRFEPRRQFDSILAGEYLEHLDDETLDKHLAKIVSLLAPGGKFVLTTPFGANLHPDHKQTFLPRSFAKTLEKYFALEIMDVEDAYLRCVCIKKDEGTSAAIDFMELTEKGGLQATAEAFSRYNPPKKETAVERPATPEQSAKAAAKKVVKPAKDKDIEAYLKEETAPSGPLLEKLAELGIKPPFRWNVDLFRALNKIYGNRPVSPKPRKIEAKALFSQASKRVDLLLSLLGDKKVAKCLEIGCGRGETSVELSMRLGCDVTGVDITEYPEWADRRSDKVELVKGNLATETLFEPESFDFIFSFVVLEHVREPLKMLEAMERLLKPGGVIYFTANLYRGPLASHRYREVFFPWPHLLFEDAVFRRYYREEQLGNGKPAWVNRLTHLHYLDKVKSLGFEIEDLSYSRKPLDREFFQCFEEKLGRYPEEDLELDFIKLKLKKPLPEPVAEATDVAIDS